MNKFTAPTFLVFASLLYLSCSPMAAESKYVIPDDTLVVLQSGNCEMGCPVFRVVIFANGEVVFQGRHHVRKPGLLLKHIEPDQIREILNEAQSVDFFNVQNIFGLHGQGCERTEPDQPIVMTSISVDGRARTLTHHRGCISGVSQRLSSLENRILQITDSPSLGN